MKKTVFYIFIVLSNITYSQDTCVANLKNQYAELAEPVTEFYHDNGELSHRHINKGKNTSKTVEWDSCGKFIRKSKSGKTAFKRTPYYKRLSVEYHTNGQVKMKKYSKMVGCWHIKRSWRKRYSKDGKRIR